MNNDIKLKINLDGNEAADGITKLDKQISKLIENLTRPVKVSIQPPEAETITGYKNLKMVINELHNAVEKPAGLSFGIQSSIAKRGSTSGKNKNGLRENVEDFTAYQKRLSEVEKKYSTQRQKISLEENRHKLSGIKFMLLSAEGLFSRQTVLYKTLSMAEATMSTYNAANAALLPPPVGAGPILGEIQAGLVIMNGLKRVEKIAASQIPGYAKGGIVIGEKGPEVIENMQDYAAGRAELIQKTIIALQREIHGSRIYPDELAGEIKNLRSDIKTILNRPAIAFLDDREAKKIYYRGSYFARKTR